MARLSTHVLDTVAGRPAAGVPVSLSRLDGEGRLQPLGGGVTDADGRIDDLLAGHDLAPVAHVAEFHVAGYLAAAGWPTIYDRVPIRFTPPADAEHLHVPLLLSPHGYTTYRGQLTMAELADGRYGKSDIRVVRVERGAERHELHDYRVDVQLAGDFAATYLAGDNTDVMATDTMRNTVYARAQAVDVRDPEVFGRDLAEHFLQASPGCREAIITLRRRTWIRTRVGGGEHPHAFQLGDGGGSHTARVVATAAGTRVTAGVDELTVLKTTGSGWAGFHRDRYTTLPETDDRILATDVRAEWDYATLDVDWTPAWERARATLLEVFATEYSRSLQQTLYAIGEAIIADEPAIEEVRLSLPNRHHLHFDLGRLDLPDERGVFHASAEPFGLIEGTIRR